MTGMDADSAVVRESLERGTPVASICVGAFLLGITGLLDGRVATTAWLYADELQERHPRARVDARRLVVTDDGVTTTAALSAMFDFVLDLTERECGSAVARATARLALLPGTRTSQSPYVDRSLLPAKVHGDVVRAAQRLLRQNLADPYDLPKLARDCRVSTRTLLRRFQQETGESPLAYAEGADRAGQAIAGAFGAELRRRTERGGLSRRGRLSRAVRPACRHKPQ